MVTKQVDDSVDESLRKWRLLRDMAAASRQICSRTEKDKGFRKWRCRSTLRILLATLPDSWFFWSQQSDTFSDCCFDVTCYFYRTETNIPQPAQSQSEHSEPAGMENDEIQQYFYIIALLSFLKYYS